MLIRTGLLRGQKLKTPPSELTRPTGALAREALLSILEANLEEATWVDLFSGSGAVGLEALGRGVSACIFVEGSKKVLEVLKGNIDLALVRFKKAEEHKEIEILNCDVALAVKRLEKAGRKADIIWADPPYKDAAHWAEALLKTIEPIAKDGAIFAMEMENRVAKNYSVSEEEEARGWVCVDYRKYGTSALVFWKMKR